MVGDLQIGKGYALAGNRRHLNCLGEAVTLTAIAVKSTPDQNFLSTGKSHSRSHIVVDSIQFSRKS
jgi:hypothetical protein